MDWYPHSEIEKKWQERWQKALMAGDDFSDREKFYLLFEFPYPSGDGLHVGHLRSYTALDVIARKLRMQGKNVLFPIGWDAFGLPTENYALKTGIHPRVATDKNIETFRRQMQSIGLSLDWSLEVDTTDPKYYKWTQWIFLQLFKKGLAYQATMPINWCPKDKIGLANEEVVQGKCERCGTDVIRKEQKQWLLKITAYADRLIDDLKLVDFPERVKTQQISWIGRSEGAEIEFQITNSELQNADSKREGADPYPRRELEFITVFTTRPDTIFGATYLVLSPEHSVMKNLQLKINNWEEVRKYIEECKKKSDLERTDLAKEKTGVELKGVMAINPATKEKIPIWIADYVLLHYGTGAIMAVPAHDERDWEFAKKFGLEIREVIEPLITEMNGDDAFREDEPAMQRDTVVCIVKHWEEEKYLCLRWKHFDWKSFVIGGTDGEDPETAARREVQEETGYQNIRSIRQLGGRVHAKYYAKHKKENHWALERPMLVELADGEHIPLASHERELHECVWMTKNEVIAFLNFSDHELIWQRYLEGETAYIGDGILANSGKFDGMEAIEAGETIAEWLAEKGVGKKAITFKLRDWIFSRQHYWGEPIPIIHCPEHGAVAVPDDQLPVELPFVEKYEPSGTGESPLANIPEFVNTKCPVCAKPAKRETDTMPNWAGSSWYYLRYCDSRNDREFAEFEKLRYWLPVDLYNGGREHTTLHLLYSRFWHKFLFDQKLVPGPEPYKRRVSHGIVLGEDGRKMSKSFGNVANPDDLIREYGADSIRVYEMFMGPYEETIPWATRGLIGVHRFLQNVYDLATQTIAPEHPEQCDLEFLAHTTIKRVAEDLDRMRFNTAVSALMEFTNALRTANRADAHFPHALRTLLLLVYPMAPHLASELWERSGESGDITNQKWPIVDAKKLVQTTITLVVQVNGKVRAKLSVPFDSNEADATKSALAEPNVAKYVSGRPKKVIFVPGRLINILV